MTAVERVVRICNSCLDGKLAVETIRFSINGRTFSGDYCAMHRDNLTRDILRWGREAEELTLEPAPEGTPDTQLVPDKDTRFPGRVPSTARPSFADRQVRVQPVTPRRVVEVVEDQVTPYVPPRMNLDGITEKTMRDWQFTGRAYDDMTETGVRPDQVWRLIDGPHDVRPAREDGNEVWDHRQLSIVVNPREKKIIHVMHHTMGRRLPLVSGGI